MLIKKSLLIMIIVNFSMNAIAEVTTLQPMMSITTSNNQVHDQALAKELKTDTPQLKSSSSDIKVPTIQQGQAIDNLPPKKHKRKISKRKVNKSDISKQKVRFDFSFHDDVNNLIGSLKDFIPTLVELKPLGKKEHFNFNVDLSNTSIDEIASSIDNQTDGRVNLIYDSSDNSARLIFIHKITKDDFASDVIQEAKKINNGNKLKLVTGTDGIIKMPFGGPYPVVCKPLKMCDIRLEQGEIVRGWTLSDKENWILPGASSPQFLYSGEDGNTTPHIILKPTEAGLDSNLIITTNKRTYNIPLQSSKDNYITAIAYYYPDEINQDFIDQKNQLRAQAQQQTSIPLNSDDSPLSGGPQGLTPENLNFNYEISGDKVDWKPVQVFDDGTHVWLKFDQNRQIYPPLFEVDPDGGKKALLIYQPMPGGYYRVDSLFNKAELVVGDGSDYEKKVIISKIVPGKPWYKSVFGS